MKKLILSVFLLSLVYSCSKIDKSLLIGTWEKDNSLVSATDTLDITITTNSSESFNNDGTYEEVLTIFMNNGLIKIKRNTVGFGTWSINDDMLTVKINKQHDDDGTVRKLDNVQNRKIISISSNEYIYSVENDSTKEIKSVVMRKVNN
jgi:hypothetical protein